MKKYRLALLLAATVTALNLSFASALMSDQEAEPLPVDTVLDTAEDEAAEEPEYLLLAVDGKVCVYQSGSLLMETDIDVSLLPAADRLDLATGIRAKGPHALAAYLEDFGA